MQLKAETLLVLDIVSVPTEYQHTLLSPSLSSFRFRTRLQYFPLQINLDPMVGSQVVHRKLFDFDIVAAVVFVGPHWMFI